MPAKNIILACIILVLGGLSGFFLGVFRSENQNQAAKKIKIDHSSRVIHETKDQDSQLKEDLSDAQRTIQALKKQLQSQKHANHSGQKAKSDDEKTSHSSNKEEEKEKNKEQGGKAYLHSQLEKLLGRKLSENEQVQASELFEELGKADASKVLATLAAREIQKNELEEKERLERLEDLSWLREDGTLKKFLELLIHGWEKEDSDLLLENIAENQELFTFFFERKGQSAWLEAESLQNQDKVETNTILSFKAGIQSLDTKKLGELRPFPKDLTIRGAGRDSTLLRIHAPISLGREGYQSLSEVKGLIFEDMTIECVEGRLFTGDIENDGSMVSEFLASTPMSIYFKSCRVVGFEDLFDYTLFEGVTLYATDSIFDGSYGFSGSDGDERPQSFLPNYSYTLLLRMERCQINEVDIYVDEFNSGYVRSYFEDCSFASSSLLEYKDKDPKEYNTTEAQISFRRCTFSGSYGEYEIQDKKQLTDINPQWIRE